jgi:TP901 family phage tail tape measure protein
LTFFGKTAVDQFAKFDDAMTQSTAIMIGLTKKQREQMEEVAKTISSKSITSAVDLAKSYYYLASAGLSAEQSIASLATVEKFAVAGMFDMARATELLAGAQGALGMKSADTAKNLKYMTQVSDTLVRANVLANASVEQFAEALGAEAGATMKNFNIPLEEGVAILAAYADQMVKGAHAGTSFARTAKFLVKAINENEAAFRKYNIRTKDTAGNLQMTNTIADITKAVSGMGATVKSATLKELGFEIDAQSAILPLLGTETALRTYRAELTKAAGYTKQVADNQLKSFSAQLTILKNRLNNVRIAIGEYLAPYVKSFTEQLDRLATIWSKLAKPIQEFLIKVGMGAAALGPLLIGLGSLVGLLATAASAFGFLVTPMGIFIGIVGSLGTYWLTSTRSGREAADFLRTGAVSAFDAVSSSIGSLIIKAKELYSRMEITFDRILKLLSVGAWQEAVTLLWATITAEFTSALASIDSGMLDWVESVYGYFADLANGIVKVMASASSLILRTFKSMFETVVQGVGDLVAYLENSATYKSLATIAKMFETIYETGKGATKTVERGFAAGVFRMKFEADADFRKDILKRAQEPKGPYQQFKTGEMMNVDAYGSTSFWGGVKSYLWDMPIQQPVDKGVYDAAFNQFFDQYKHNGVATGTQWADFSALEKISKDLDKIQQEGFIAPTFDLKSSIKAMNDSAQENLAQARMGIRSRLDYLNKDALGVSAYGWDAGSRNKGAASTATATPNLLAYPSFVDNAAEAAKKSEGLISDLSSNARWKKTQANMYRFAGEAVPEYLKPKVEKQESPVDTSEHMVGGSFLADRLQGVMGAAADTPEQKIQKEQLAIQKAQLAALKEMIEKDPGKTTKGTVKVI